MRTREPYLDPGAPARWRRQPETRRPWGALLLMAVTAGCDLTDAVPSLSKSDEDLALLPDGPAPPENGQKLGSIANQTPIFERPSVRAKKIGFLRAGAFVPRSSEPIRKAKECEAGYFAIFPRGFVCLNQGATLDLAHPTLAAMAQGPAFDDTLPYTYARTRVETGLLERVLNSEAAVQQVQKLARGSGFAVVGSWTASIDGGEPERLGLLKSGRFVRARDMQAAESSDFSGYVLGDGRALPLAFVVKRGVRRFKLDGDSFEKDELLDYHAKLALSGRYRTVNGVRFWATLDSEFWVRNQDVTIVHRRTKVPDFVREGQKWLDIGVTLGTLVAYEGEKPVFATLVSTGRERLGDPELTENQEGVTRLGTFEVTNRSISLLDAPPDRPGERYSLFDLPWALELSSGQMLYAAYWHDRFGIEHGSGDIMLAPGDARHVWHWAAPPLPKGWHSELTDAKETLVNVRK